MLIDNLFAAAGAEKAVDVVVVPTANAQLLDGLLGRNDLHDKYPFLSYSAPGRWAVPVSRPSLWLYHTILYPRSE